MDKSQISLGSWIFFIGMNWRSWCKYFLGPGRLGALRSRGLRLQLLSWRRRLLVPVAEVLVGNSPDAGRGPRQRKEQEQEQEQPGRG